MKSYLKIPIYFIAFIAVGLLTAYATFILLTSTKTYDVPVLAGKSLLEANKILSEKKLFLKMDGEEYDADTPAGYILKQDIPAKNRIKEGRTIGVIISKGPKILYVPVLTGLSLDDAEALAKQNNIKVDRVIRVHSGTVENNKVIAQDPNPEEHGAGGMTIVVSSGRFDENIICPPFENLQLEAARNLAGKLGINIATSGDGSLVSAQNPPANTLIRKGDTVRLQLKEEEQKWWF